MPSLTSRLKGQPHLRDYRSTLTLTLTLNLKLNINLNVILNLTLNLNLNINLSLSLNLKLQPKQDKTRQTRQDKTKADLFQTPLGSSAYRAAAEGVKGGGDLRQGREDKTSKAKTRQDKTRQKKTRQDNTKANLFKTSFAPLLPFALTSGAALAAAGGSRGAEGGGGT